MKEIDVVSPAGIVPARIYGNRMLATSLGNCSAMDAKTSYNKVGNLMLEKEAISEAFGVICNFGRPSKTVYRQILFIHALFFRQQGKYKQELLW